MGARERKSECDGLKWKEGSKGSCDVASSSRAKVVRKARMYVRTGMVEGSEKALSAKQDKTSNILEKLRHRAEQIGYGSLICEIQVHEGQIRQVDITTVKERMRAD